MKHTAVALSLSIALVGLAAWGVSRAQTVQPPPVPSGYSASALYDLGNFYARMGRPAWAVLSYERALVFAPTDPDIQANLRHVRESVGAPVPNDSGWRHHARWMNPNTLYSIGLFGLALAGISLLSRRSWASHRTVLGAGAALGVTLVVLAVGDALAMAPTLAESVVMFPSSASASPISGAEPLFTVPLADVVSVRSEHQGYDLIVDSQGREGWVAASNLQPIIPRSDASHGIRKVIH